MSDTVTVTNVISQPELNHTRTPGRFYVGAGAFVILLNIGGFLPSFVDQSKRLGEPTWIVLMHGALAGAWLLLFLVQAALVATRRTAVHRRIGAAGPFIALSMIAIGCLMVVEMARRGFDLSGDIARVLTPPGSPAPAAEEAAAQMLPPLLAFANFGILSGLGLWYRHRPAIHKRLMLLAFAPLVVTPLIHLSGHLIGAWPDLHSPLNIVVPVLVNALPFAGAVHDRHSRGRVHPISLWVPILLLVQPLGIALVMSSGGWRRLAMWLVS
jgi:hypothetical protein